MKIKITYTEPPLLVEAEIDGVNGCLSDRDIDFLMARIAAMKKAAIKQAISVDKSNKSSVKEKVDKVFDETIDSLFDPGRPGGNREAIELLRKAREAIYKEDAVENDDKPKPRDIFMWVIRIGDTTTFYYNKPYQNKSKTGWYADGQSITTTSPLLWLTDIPQNELKRFKLVPEED